MAAEFELIVFQDDDATPLFAVGTAATHPNPFLRAPDQFGEAEVDLRAGTSVIGQINAVVIDPQTGATQAERFLTALLGSPSGYSQLNGRRALFRQVSPSSVVVIDGVVGGVTLNETFAGFTLPIRDIRERGRKVKIFARGGTTTVLPRGVLNGYGLLPTGEYLISPTEPLRARALGHGGLVDLRPHHWSEDGAWVDPRLGVTDAFRKAFRSVVTKAERDGETGYLFSYPDVRILWRLVGSSAPMEEVELSEMFTTNEAGQRHFSTGLARSRSSPSPDQIEAVSHLWIPFLAAPPVGSDIEVILLFVGEPTEDAPWHFEGTAGELLRNVYRGDYCALDEDGDPIDPRIRYDESRLVGPTASAAMNTPVRLRITEPEDDLREWTEKAHRALRTAPALSPDGEISPVDSRLPDVDAELVQLDDTNCAALAGWDHPVSTAVTMVRMKYPRDYRVPADLDPTGANSKGDGLASRDVEVIHRAPPEVIDLIGEKPLEIDGILFRALGGTQGEPLTGDVSDETGAQIAREAAASTIDRFAFGGQTGFMRAARTDDGVAAIRPGDWIIDARSWRPNYVTGERGGNALAQVVAVRDLNPAWREIRTVDSGPADSPLPQPTIGEPTADASGVITVPVLSIPAGAECRIDYASSPTLPAANSGAWVFMGRTAIEEPVSSPPQMAGGEIWVRARSEATGRRPSAWTAPFSVSTPETPRIQGARIEVADDGTPTIYWTPNAFALGVRIAHHVHALTEIASPVGAIEVAASAGSYTLTGVIVPTDQFITVDLTPFPGWTGSAVSGAPGAPHRISTRSGASPLTTLVMIRDWKPVPALETEAHKTWAGIPTDAVAMITIHDFLVERPYASPAQVLPGPTSTRRPERSILRPAPGPWALSVEFEKPPEGYDRLIQVEPRDVNGDAGKIERMVMEGHQAAIQLPTIEWIEQAPTEVPGATGLRVRVSDPSGRAGVLFVWLNPDSTDNPDPTGPPDGSISIAATPHTVVTTDQFILTAGGNRALFAAIKVHGGRGKRIFLEFVTEDGVSTGKVDKALQSWLNLIDPTGTGFLQESVDEAALALRSVGTYQLKLAGVARDNIIQKAVNAALLDDNILDLTEFDRVVMDNAIVAGKLAVNELSEIADDVGIVVHGELRNAAGTRYINLDAAGHQPFIASEGLTVWADGDAEFRGVLTASVVMAARIVQSGNIGDGAIDLPGLFVDGVVRAAAMQMATLSEIKRADGTSVGLGIVLEGVLRNAPNTAGIRLAATDTKPGSWTSYLDLAAAGTLGPFLKHPGLELRGDGAAILDGEVRITNGKGIYFGSGGSSWDWGSLVPYQTGSPGQYGLQIEAYGRDALTLYRHLNVSVGTDRLHFLFEGQQVVTVYVGSTRPSNPVEGTLRVE